MVVSAHYKSLLLLFLLSYMGRTVNAGISTWNEGCSAFPLRDAKSCIDCQPHKG